MARTLTPEELLRRNRQAAQKAAEEVGVARLKKLLERSAADLAARLAKAEGLRGAGKDSFTAVQARAVLGQVQDVLRALKPGMKGVLVDQAVRASKVQTASVLKYLNDAEKHFTGVAAPLPISDAAVYDHVRQGAESSVLRRILSDPAHPAHPGVLDRYGEQVIGDFEASLAQRVLTKKPWAEVRDDLVKSSPFLQKAPAHWAERIVRTESMAASNRSSLEAIKVTETALGDVVKILSATFDNRTAADSYAVHGQIRRPDEPFQDWKHSYMHPPNRPNDREVVLPHRLSWPLPKSLLPKSDAEVASAWVRDGRKGSPPARPKYSTVDTKLFGQSPAAIGGAGAAPAGLAAPATPAQAPAPASAPQAPPPPPPAAVQAAPPAPSPSSGRSRLVEPEARAVMHPGDDIPAFVDADGAPIALGITEQLGVEHLYKMKADKDGGLGLKTFMPVGTPKVDDSQPYADVLKQLGSIEDAIAKLGHRKLVKPLDAHQLVFEQPTFDREVAARFAALPVVGEAPTVIKHQGKYYVRDGVEMIAAQHALQEGGLGRKRMPIEITLVDLDKLARPMRPAVEWAQSGVDAIDSLGTGVGGGPKTRLFVREALLHHGIATQDDRRTHTPGEVEFTNPPEMRLRIQDIPGAAGSHANDGTITLPPSEVLAAKNAMQALVMAGPDKFRLLPLSVQNTLLDKISTIVHEELHGASMTSGGSYVGSGIGIEEAATETLSRKITREVAGHTSNTNGALGLPTLQPDGRYAATTGSTNAYFGAYNRYIAIVLEQTAEVMGHADVHTQMETAFLKTRAIPPTRPWTSGKEQIEAYATALGLTGAKHTELVSRLDAELLAHKLKVDSVYGGGKP